MSAMLSSADSAFIAEHVSNADSAFIAEHARLALDKYDTCDHAGTGEMLGKLDSFVGRACVCRRAENKQGR
jgi:hypothetical protein